MTKPLPPLLFGPLFPASTIVKTGGALDGATVTIYIDGKAAASDPLPIDGWVKIGKPLKRDQVVTATQTVGGEESEQTVGGIGVQAPPETLSTPEFATIINNFSTVVGMDRLDIGATLTITLSDDGQVVAAVQVDRQFMYVRLDKNISIISAGSLTAWQTLGAKTSGPRRSPPLRNIDFLVKARTAPQPRGFPPFVSCQSALRLGGEPGLDVVVHNEGQDTSFIVNYPQDFDVTDCQTLRQGKLLISQEVERLGIKATSDTFQVDPPPPPGKPTVIGPYCPKTAHLWVTGLVPGAQLSLFAQGLGTPEWVLVGRAQADASAQKMPVPADELPANPTPSLRVTQSLCEFESAPSDPVSLPGPTPQRDPKFKFPIVDCSDFAMVADVLPGGMIFLWDAKGEPIADPTCVTGDPTYVKLYRPVHATGDVVGGTVQYCDVAREIEKFTVVGVPSASTFLHPVKPSDTELHFSKCVVGSRIELSYQPPRETRNPDKSLVFVGAYYPQDEEWRIPIPVAIELGGEFQFVVRVCDGLATKGAQTVKLGTMKVAATPGTVTAGKTARLVVTSDDADTGEKVLARVFDAGGQVLGGTFDEINFTAQAGATSVTLTVKANGDAYEPASVTIAVVKPAPPPAPPARVHVKLVSKAPGNEVEQHIDYDMTVTGSNCPPGAAVTVSAIYMDVTGYDAGGNLIIKQQTKQVATATVASSDGNGQTKGGFSTPASFTVPMYDAATGTSLNTGFMAQVKVGSLTFQKNLLVNGDDTDLPPA